MPRYFKKISINQLQEKINQARGFIFSQIEPLVFGNKTYPQFKATIIKQLEDFDDLFYGWPHKLSSTVNKDLSKVEFDYENLSDDGDGDPFGPKELIGFHTLDNGLTFCGCCAGGDWERPIFFIIYWDGNKLRGFIPEGGGNVWNKQTKQAFGNNGGDEDKDFDSFEWNSDELIQIIKNRIQEKV